MHKASAQNVVCSYGNDIRYNLIGQYGEKEKPFDHDGHLRYVKQFNKNLSELRTKKGEALEDLYKPGDHLFYRLKGDKSPDRSEGICVHIDLPEVTILSPTGYLITRHIKHVVKV